MPRLIVNADDYGLTTGVNRGIGQVFAAGGLTSATLMACGLQVAAAAEFARTNPLLGVGCHVVLLDGAPVAPAHQVASLLAPGTQVFYPTLGSFLRALCLGKIRREHIAIEVAAQLERLRALGIEPTHVDTHKHTHMFPAVLAPLLEAAAAHGVRAVRNPFEPGWAVEAAQSAGLVRRIEVRGLRRLHRQNFLKTAAAQQFVTTDGCIGVAATGSLNADTLRCLVSNLPEGTWELCCHPGHIDDELAAVTTRLRQSRETEVAALLDLPAMLPTGTHPTGTQLVNFGELTR